MVSPSRPWLRAMRIGLPIFGGAIAGLCASMLAQRLAPVRAIELGHSAIEPRPVPESAAVVRLDDRRLGEVEAKLAALEQRPPIPSLPDADAGEAHRRSPEENAERFKEHLAKRLADQAAEPAEPAWAAKTSTLLRTDIHDIATQSRFRLLNVDCRTTLCLARVEWESRGAASDEYRRLVHHPYRANCGKSVLVDENVNPNGSVGGSVLFECEEWRGSGEQESRIAPPLYR
jgi:hypothetical protein